MIAMQVPIPQDASFLSLAASVRFIRSENHVSIKSSVRFASVLRQR